MRSPYRVFFDKVLTRTDAERAHQMAFRAIRSARPVLASQVGTKLREAGRDITPEPVVAFGLTFPNRVGLAAGFDKNAVGIDALGALGFGHVEIGTVTGQAQPGNPKPRLFRLPDDRAVVNRMGFNNHGAEVVAHRLAERAQMRVHGIANGPVLGVNIGKTKVVPDDDLGAVIADYEFSARHLAPHADYLVVNVSSPNTPGLRNLQAVEKLEPILTAVRRTADQVSTRRVPLLVKIAPDLADDDVDAVADLATAIELDGMIATNTTVSREGLRTDPSKVDSLGAGGISGAPVRDRALEVLRRLRARADDKVELIGVGGISTPEDAAARIDAGAVLVQGYTGFIYDGPFWPTRILAGLGADGHRPALDHGRGVGRATAGCLRGAHAGSG
ncbi:quinone-dependent dihydroorotate dehydrogenase [Nocardioides alcanivorans]|uniref:quinone-dependent dihydroorotate dehydrogenase n=1 Tax=Nocardioides alcanivorans TaxID=2897352 RepID=UPI001F44C7A0|nr:quinone-dependent dihydroorotate dehydrogenase [Nocardioides alcanivorans]